MAGLDFELKQPDFNLGADLVYKVRAEDVRVDHNQKQRTKDKGEELNETHGRSSFVKQLRSCEGRSGPPDCCLGLPKLLH